MLTALDALYTHATANGHKACVLCFTEHMETLAHCAPHDMGSRANPAEVAQRLFALLRDMDTEHMEVIFSEVVPPEGVGLAVMNRLGRAAAFRRIEAGAVCEMVGE